MFANEHKHSCFSGERKNIEFCKSFASKHKIFLGEHKTRENAMFLLGMQMFCEHRFPITIYTTIRGYVVIKLN